MDSTLSSHLIVGALVLTAVLFLVFFELDSRRNEARRENAHARERLAGGRTPQEKECA